MSVVFSSKASEVKIEVGTYQKFPKAEPVEAAMIRTPNPKFRHCSLVLVSFGLLCVLQAILNISLRLAKPTEKAETEEARCPKGWITFGSSCYYISSNSKSWDDSRKDCVQRDADLVVINTRQEQAFLTGFTMAAWVGMTDRQEEGTWIWVDGTPLNKRLQWATGQPDGWLGREDCGELRTMIDFIGLNDFNCNARSRWICEKPLR